MATYIRELASGETEVSRPNYIHSSSSKDLWPYPGGRGGGGHSIWYLGMHPRTKKRRKGVILVTDWWGPGTSESGVFSPKG